MSAREQGRVRSRDALFNLRRGGSLEAYERRPANVVLLIADAGEKLSIENVVGRFDDRRSWAVCCYDLVTRSSAPDGGEKV